MHTKGNAPAMRATVALQTVTELSHLVVYPCSELNLKFLRDLATGLDIDSR